MDRLERFARRDPVLFSFLLGLGALALRLSLVLMTAAIVGTQARNLALFYDGLSYIYIAKTFPWIYVAVPKDFPVFYKPVVFTAWFPVFPFMIRAADLAFHDARLSALVVAQAAGSLAVVVFYRLARFFCARPAFAALVFCAFPPTWLLAGSVAMVESVFVCAGLAAFLCWKKGDVVQAAAWASIAAITQKSGFLVIAAIGLAELWRHGASGLRRTAPLALSLVPVLLLQIYLGLEFRDPWVSLKVLREINNGASFQFPFSGFLAGLLGSTQAFNGCFWLRKSLLALSCGFYMAVLAAAWGRRARLDRGLIVWLGTVLLFNASLGGASAYFPFPRQMTLGAPAAVLLAAELMPAALARRSFALGGLLLASISAGLIIGAWDIIAAMELELRLWPRGYFQLLMRVFSGGG